MANQITRISVLEFRDNLAHWLNIAYYREERIIITRHGKDVAFLVPFKDRERLKKLEEIVAQKTD